MSKICTRCGRPRGAPDHLYGICDTVLLSNYRTVHRDRIEVGGDLHGTIGDDLSIVHRNITPEMREQHKKSESK